MGTFILRSPDAVYRDDAGYSMLEERRMNAEYRTKANQSADSGVGVWGIKYYFRGNRFIVQPGCDIRISKAGGTGGNDDGV